MMRKSGSRFFASASIALLIVAALGNTTIALSPLLAAGMSQYLRYDDALIGSLAGAQSTGAAISTVAAIFLLDRAGWPLRRTALISLVVYSVGTCLAPIFFGRPDLLMLAFFVWGGASGLVWAACATAVMALPDNSRLIAVFYGVPYATGLVVQPIMPSLYAHWGVGIAFELIGLACLGGFAVMRWMPDRAIGPVTQGDRNEHPGEASSGTWLILLPMVIALFLQYVANSGLWVYFDRIGIVSGHSSQVSANVVAVGGGMALVGTAFAAAFAKRLNAVTVIIALSIALALCTICLLWSANLLVFAGAVFAFNASITLITPSYFILIARNSISSGKAALVSNLCMMAGFAAGPVVIGRLVSGVDFGFAIYGTAVLFILGAVLVAAAIWRSRCSRPVG